MRNIWYPLKNGLEFRWLTQPAVNPTHLHKTMGPDLQTPLPPHIFPKLIWASTFKCLRFVQALPSLDHYARIHLCWYQLTRDKPSYLPRLLALVLHRRAHTTPANDCSTATVPVALCVTRGWAAAEARAPRVAVCHLGVGQSSASALLSGPVTPHSAWGWVRAPRAHRCGRRPPPPRTSLTPEDVGGK